MKKLTEIMSPNMLQLEYMTQMSRAKACTLRVKFVRLFSKFHDRGWIYRNIINGYDNWKTDLILNFLENCERDYIVRERRFLQLKEDIVKEINENMIINEEKA